MKTNNRKYKVCIFIKDLSAGGAEKQAILLSEMLSEYHKVYLVLFNKRIDKVYNNYIENKNYELLLLNGNIISKSIQLAKYLKKQKIEVIFCYLFLANFIGGIAGIVAKVTYRIGGIRSSLLEGYKVIAEKFIHNFINTYTIFNNYAGYDRYINQGFRKDKCLVIPNFINVSEYVDQSKSRKEISSIVKSNDLNITNKVSILSVGRFVEAKDYNTSLQVIKELVDKGYINISYTIIGFGHLENEIRNQIKSKNLNSFLNVVINPKNIMTYYDKADIYLMTSIFEGLSNTIMEAMCFSLPIVSTNVGDNFHLVEHRKNGFLSKPKDVESLMNSIIELIENDELRKSFGINSFERISKKYSRKAFEKNYLNLLKSLKK